MILLWKLLARIVFYLNFLSNTVSLVVSSLFVFFAVAIVLSIKLLLIQQSNLDCACAVVYSTGSPSSFSVYSFVRICEVFRIKGVRISEVLLYNQAGMHAGTFIVSAWLYT